jgi:hypothetical protein
VRDLDRALAFYQVLDGSCAYAGARRPMQVADKIIMRPVEALIPYARNARTTPSAGSSPVRRPLRRARNTTESQQIRRSRADGSTRADTLPRCTSRLSKKRARRPMQVADKRRSGMSETVDIERVRSPAMALTPPAAPAEGGPFPTGPIRAGSSGTSKRRSLSIGK